MKLYEIDHINETHNSKSVYGLELEFVHAIDSTTGKTFTANKQPDDYDHVKRLTHMLFLAWNDSNPLEGVVYFGRLFDPNDETYKFYKFFKRFNGFSINDDQKKMYKLIKNGGHTTNSRQRGATVLLLTIAAWESLKGKKVKYIAHNNDTANRYRRDFKLRWTNVSDSSIDNVDFITPHVNPRESFVGYSNMRVIFDNYMYFSKYGNNSDFWSKYEAATKFIPDFKDYGINTIE